MLPAALMRCLARLILAAMVASGTRNARAISAVVRPPTARSVSAVADAAVSVGWQHRKSSTSVSSVPGTSSGGVSAAIALSRSRRAWSLRIWSISRREATVISQPRGLSGTPSAGHCTAAASTRLLDGVLAPLELAVPAHQPAEDLRRELAQQVLDGGGGHASSVPSENITWRTSTPSPSIAASGIWAASSIARSLLSQSIR